MLVAKALAPRPGLCLVHPGGSRADITRERDAPSKRGPIWRMSTIVSSSPVCRLETVASRSRVMSGARAPWMHQTQSWSRRESLGDEHS